MTWSAFHACSLGCVLGALGARAGVAGEGSLRAAEPIVPWCRKSAVFAAAPAGSLGASSEGSVLLWSGKAHDKAEKSHGSSLVNDLWVLTVKTTDDGAVENGGVAWKRQAEALAQSPAGRWKSSGDVLGGELVIFGGDDGSKFGDDLWALPLSELNSDSEAVWHQPVLAQGSTVPPGRRGHVLVAFEDQHAFALVGGRMKHHVCLPDAWVLVVPTSDAENAWKSAHWVQIDGIPSACRWGHAATLAKDPLTSTEIVAVFGGRYENADGDMVYLDDLWFLNLAVNTVTGEATGTWSQALTEKGVRPPARDHHTMVYDGESESLFVFAGRKSVTTEPALPDLWKYSLRDSQWVQLTPSGFRPETRYVHSAAFVNGVMVVFGGEHFKKQQEKSKDHKLNDVWVYSPKKNLWTQLTRSNCLAGDMGKVVHVNSTRITFFVVVLGVVLAGLFGLANRWQSHGSAGLLNYLANTVDQRHGPSQRRTEFKVEYSPLR
eukprot:CAMPEP_0118966868 /NCGR_PEP_ID=MMETSP1173-20130426/4329_1 /TAXON_ID=1034831 /ORGANISM="Rhizochromulina marina cf, Strain CCMP1243" /LENGTH=489 /DNA_ID=CAMNT_0006915739 /DNA_START=22 /DNA_END=1491 /DNA_ORIENTATION=-